MPLSSRTVASPSAREVVVVRVAPATAPMPPAMPVAAPAASPTLLLIVAVVAVCSSTAEAMVPW